MPEGVVGLVEVNTNLASQVGEVAFGMDSVEDLFAALVVG